MMPDPETVSSYLDSWTTRSTATPTESDSTASCNTQVPSAECSRSLADGSSASCRTPAWAVGADVAAYRRLRASGVQANSRCRAMVALRDRLLHSESYRVAYE